MRAILFRGKRLDDGEWAEGGIYHNSEDEIVFIIKDTGLGYHEFIEVIPETVGQFTGVFANDGTMVFEGDIVVCKKEINGNWVDYCVEIGFVEMKHGAFGLHREKGYYRPFKDWLEDYEYEVIGNIHDNPELLER